MIRHRSVPGHVHQKGKELTVIARREPPAWAHHVARFLPVMPVAGAVATAILGPWNQLGDPGYMHWTSSDRPNSPLWQTVLVIAVILLFFVSLTIAVWHGQQLCPRCAMLTPLDPQVAVTKWRRALRMCHLKGRGRVMIWYIVGFLAVLIFLPNGWPMTIIFTCFWLVIAIWDFAQWKHSLLQPWCPWCHFGDGGDGEEEISPDPEPSMELT